MDKQLLPILINNIVVPEIVAFIRRRHADTGDFPTDDEVIAELNFDADQVITKGEAWLAEHPPTT